MELSSLGCQQTLLPNQHGLQQPLPGLVTIWLAG